MPKGSGRPKNKMERDYPVQKRYSKEHRDGVRDYYREHKIERQPAEAYGRIETKPRSKYNEKKGIYE